MVVLISPGGNFPSKKNKFSATFIRISTEYLVKINYQDKARTLDKGKHKKFGFWIDLDFLEYRLTSDLAS
jgi:hypothetical protein